MFHVLQFLAVNMSWWADKGMMDIVVRYNQRCSVSLPVYRSPPPFLKNASRCRRSLAPCTRLPINKPHKRSSLFFQFWSVITFVLGSHAFYLLLSLPVHFLQNTSRCRRLLTPWTRLTIKKHQGIPGEVRLQWHSPLSWFWSVIKSMLGWHALLLPLFSVAGVSASFITTSLCTGLE